MDLRSDVDLTLESDDVKEGLDNANMEMKQDEAPNKKKRKTRGPTMMHDVTKIRSVGERKLVDYNDDGVPINNNGHKLKSFIGSCVHHHIPIIYASWKRVPSELKEKIYNMVEGAFIIDGRSKKVIMKTAGVAFRQFKSWLTTQYIVPCKDEPQLLLKPPSMYSHMIETQHWLEFVKSRLSPEFQEVRSKQQARRKQNKYNHRLSRRGYANLAEEMKKLPSNESDFGRASMWKKARTNKKGEFDNEDVQQVANRIDEIVNNGNPISNKNYSPNDALTQALGTPEYAGRVRGVGGFLTPTVYFHTAKPRKSKKVDPNKKIIDENEALRKRIRELEEQLQNMPTSEHGNCSKNKIQKKQKAHMAKDKQKAHVAKDKVKENEIVSAPITHVAKEKEKVSMKMVKKIIIRVPPLSYEAKKKISKKVVKEKKVKATGVPMVSPISKETIKEKEVKATSVLSLSPISKKAIKEKEVIATSILPISPILKNAVKEKDLRTMAKEIEVTSASSNLSMPLKYILRYAEKVMVERSSISFQLPLEVFGFSRKSYVLREDVIDFCSMQKVNTLSMVAYITYLHSLIVGSKKVLKYIFVDPSLISTGQSTQEIRARNLCSRLITSKQDQLVIAPYNPGGHWSLVVINAYDDVVYYLDSMRTRLRGDIKYITNMALTIFQSQKNLKRTRKTTLWKVVKCPLQVGTVECGYYVMRYMREIMTKDKSVITDAIDTRSSYSQFELDEVRVEWAEFLACCI